MSKHTQGPLTVAVSEKWPFDIVTTDASGIVKFVTRMPCYSSEDKKAEDAIECRHFKHSEREEYAAINRRAIADEVLRAAAPELLEALKALLDAEVYADGEGVCAIANTDIDESKKAVQAARAAIEKAEGEQQ